MRFAAKTYCACVLVLLIPMFLFMGLQAVQVGIGHGGMSLSSIVFDIVLSVVGLIVVLMFLSALMLNKGPLGGFSGQ